MKIFRVDDPHTKPLPFWGWMIRDIQDRDPEVPFPSEAFTRPKMMRRLAKLGFSPSYTNEGTPIPGKEDYLNSEKYELKAWDWDRPGNLRAF